MIPVKPDNEAQRLEALRSYNLMDTVPEAEIDDVTRIASAICRKPVSLITLVDSDRQWFKSVMGLDIREMPRDMSFCAHAILSPLDITIVPDARLDARFRDNPLVTGDTRMTFYAGVPLVNEDGYALGTLCVIDNKPGHLDEEQTATLKALGKQVVRQFELRRKIRELDEREQQLAAAYEDIDQFSQIVAHDLKAPCSNVYLLSDLVQNALKDTSDGRLKMQAGLLKKSSLEMCRMIDGILLYAKSSHLPPGRKEEFSLAALIADICSLAGIAPEVVRLPEAALRLNTYRTPLQQILLNLMVNAVAHNNAALPEIRITCREDADAYSICLSDNGPGMSAELQERAFDLFYSGDDGRQGSGGHGIGLATVKKLVRKLNGDIRVDSAPGKGTAFTFTIGK